MTIHHESPLERLDKARIIGLLEGVNLTGYHRAEVQACVEQALETWFDDDFEKYEIRSIEQVVDEPLDFWPFKFRWIPDLDLQTDRGITVIDWKTANSLGPHWVTKYKDSWQWPIYMYFIQRANPGVPVEFIFRGIQKNAESPPIHITFDSETDAVKRRVEQVPRFLEDFGAMLETLRDKPVWPQYRPSACTAYNSRCNHYTRCFAGTQTQGVLDLQHLSFSTITSIMRCPENARLTKILGMPDNDPVLIIGGAVHELLADAYTQMEEMKNGGSS